MAMIDFNQVPAKAVHAAGALCCVALLGVGYLGGGRALLSEDVASSNLSGELHDAESDAALIAATVQRLEREVDHARRQVDNKPMSLLPATVLNRRLAEVSALAQGHGLTLASSQSGQETRLAYYAFVPITVGGDGQLADVVRFLGALHERFPDMGVRAFDVTRDPIGGGRFTLTLNWYVQPARSADAS